MTTNLSLDAAPGVVIVECMPDPEEKSKGGIVLAKQDKYKRLGMGRVVSAGEWVASRAGFVVRPRGWLKPGDIVQFSAPNAFSVQDVDGRDVISVNCEDIKTGPYQESQGTMRHTISSAVPL